MAKQRKAVEVLTRAKAVGAKGDCALTPGFAKFLRTVKAGAPRRSGKVR